MNDWSDWKIERVAKDAPFKRIRIHAPNGYSTIVDSLARNPENILYMMAETILNERERNSLNTHR